VEELASVHMEFGGPNVASAEALKCANMAGRSTIARIVEEVAFANMEGRSAIVATVAVPESVLTADRSSSVPTVAALVYACTEGKETAVVLVEDLLAAITTSSAMLARSARTLSATWESVLVGASPVLQI
jgi:hypothetical protein